MASLSNYGLAAVLNALLRQQSYTATSAYVALYSSDPGMTDTGTEISGAGYARMPVTFGAPVAGVCSNTAAVIFPTAIGDWGNVTHAGIRDALTGGHLLFHGILDFPETVLANDAFEFKIGEIVCTLA